MWQRFSITVAACTALLANSPLAHSATPQAQDQTAHGVLQTTAGTYEFTPTSCAIYKEDDVDDIEISGPGVAPDGEQFYFDFTSTGNEMTIELGVDRPFASSERKLTAGQYVSRAFSLEVADRVVSIASLAVVNEHGQTIDPDASLRIDCR